MWKFTICNSFGYTDVYIFQDYINNPSDKGCKLNSRKTFIRPPGRLLQRRSRTAATSKMGCFVIIVNGSQPLTIITKRSILDAAAVLDPPLFCMFKLRPVYRGDLKIELIHWPDFIWVSKGSCSCLLFPAFFLCTKLLLWTWIICWSSTLLSPASFAPSWTALIYHFVLSCFNGGFKTRVCFFTFTATQGWDPTKKFQIKDQM